MRIPTTPACILLLTCLLPGCGTFAGAGPSTTPAPRESEFWAKRHAAHLEIARTTQPDVVFLGDSIIAGWKKAGKQAWDEQWAPRNAANYGIPGDRTENVLQRIDDGLLDGAEVRVVVLQIGTNNLKSRHVSEPRKDAAQGILAVVDLVHEKQPDAAIIVMAIFPRQPQYGWMQDAVGQTNAKVARGLRQRGHARFVDIGDRLVDEQGLPSRALMRDDLLHLNSAGYAVWAEQIVGLVDAALDAEAGE